MKHYIYVLLRANQAPFYIGMGQGDRCVEHFRAAKRGDNSHRSRIIRLGGATCVKLAEGLDKDQAEQLEKDMIRLLGREPLGPLINRTDGGDGCNNMSTEGRASIAAANRAREWSDETLAVIAEQTAQRNREREWSEASRQKIGRRSTGNKYAVGCVRTEVQRAAVAESNRRRARIREERAP